MSAKRVLLWAAAGVFLAVVSTFAVLLISHQRGWFEPQTPGGAPTMRLISGEQYRAIAHDLFGDDITVELNTTLHQRRQGLVALGAVSAEVTPGALEEYERAARKIATQVVDETHRAALIPCAPVSERDADQECAAKFLSRVGRFLYRRPLTGAEVDAQAAIAGKVAHELGDFYAGLRYALAGMLTSPKFIYISEAAEPDPGRAGEVRLDAFSKATRLSLFLWNALPDEALLDAAQKGALHEQKGLEREIDRMLASPRLEEGVEAFFSDLLGFNDFDTLSKDPVIYPAFTQSVAASAKQQTLRLISDFLIVQRRDYRNLFTASSTFADATLAPFYKATVPAPHDWVAVELDASESAGLLTSLSFLTLHSHPGRSSPTRRGKAFREQLLCQSVPEPPPNVSFEIFEDPNSHFRTARERLAAHNSDPVCAGCHKLTDPIGLALENFDGAGQFRAMDGDAAIDVSGSLDGTPFTDVAGLGAAIRDHPALTSCLASRLYAYGVGREIENVDRPWLAFLFRRFAVHGYRLPDLMREIGASRAFYAVRTPEVHDAAEIRTAAVLNGVERPQ